MRRSWFLAVTVLILGGIALPERSTSAVASRGSAGVAAARGSCVTVVTKKKGKKKKSQVCPLAQTQVNSSDLFATCSASGDGATKNYAGTAVNPRVAVNPKNAKDLAVVWAQDVWDMRGARGLVAAHSTDGGKTWKETPLPFTQCGAAALGLTHHLQARAPGAAPLTYHLIDGGEPLWFPTGGPFATLVVVGAPYTFNPDGSETSGVYILVSTDGGQTWSTPEALDSVASSQTDSVLDTEVTGNGNDAQVIEDKFSSQNDQITGLLSDCKFAPSPNPPACSPPMIIPNGELKNVSVSNIFAAGPGDLFRLFTGSSGSGSDVFSQRFSNGAWLNPVIVAPFYTGSTKVNGGQLLVDNTPYAAIDPKTGTVYIEWSEFEPSQPGPPVVVMSRSTDGGQTWGAPVRVSNQDGSFAPRLFINTQGTLGSLSFSINIGGAAAGNVPAGFELDASKDGGATWTHQTFDPFNANGFPSLFDNKFLYLHAPGDAVILPSLPFVDSAVSDGNKILVQGQVM